MLPPGTAPPARPVGRADARPRLTPAASRILDEALKAVYAGKPLHRRPEPSPPPIRIDVRV